MSQEFSNYTMSFEKDKLVEFPFLNYNPDGDFIEIFTSRTNYFVNYIGKGVAVHFNQYNHDEMVGLTIECISRKFTNFTKSSARSYYLSENDVYICCNCSDKLEIRLKDLTLYSEIEREKESKIVGVKILNFEKFNES